jgi:hypothetical protein
MAGVTVRLSPETVIRAWRALNRMRKSNLIVNLTSDGAVIQVRAHSPYNTMRKGRACGKASAYIKRLFVYASDVTVESAMGG